MRSLQARRVREDRSLGDDLADCGSSLGFDSNKKWQNGRGSRSRRESPQSESIHADLRGLERPLRDRGLTALALFGSTVRGTSRPDSDIDVLIDVDPKVKFSLIDLVSVQDFLEDRLGRKVDVVTREGLDPAIRDRILREARQVF